MPFEGRYIFSAAMDISPDKDALFNEVYDTEHVPLLKPVPGVISIARFKRRDVTLMLGGKRQTITFDAEPSYTALYELSSPDVLTTDAWARAVEEGRWPAQVRPHTTNRKHLLFERLG